MSLAAYDACTILVLVYGCSRTTGGIIVSGLAELLDQLALAPALPGARCKNRIELFDLTVTGRRGGDHRPHLRPRRPL